MRIVNFSEARNSLKAVIDQVIDDADYTVIARRDAPDAVVMSMETFNSLMETVHLLRSPANAAHLARSIDQYRQGNLVQRGLADAGQRETDEADLDAGGLGGPRVLPRPGQENPEAYQRSDHGLPAPPSQRYWKARALERKPLGFLVQAHRRHTPTGLLH